MFLNRNIAGEEIAKALNEYRNNSSACVIALPRGGVVLGCEIARKLELPLDILLVRKIGMPKNPEYAIGALSEHGEILMDDEVVKSESIPWRYIDEIILQEKKKIQQSQKRYETVRKQIDLKGKTVLLVDDGLATGSTMKAAILDLQKQGPEKVIVAVPVGSMDAIRMVEPLAQVLCLEIPEPFFAVGNHYVEFGEVSDEEVIRLLSA